jgi:hypothetical protein
MWERGTDAIVREAERATEDEVADYAFDRDPDLQLTDQDSDDEGLNQVNDWLNNPIDDEELAATSNDGFGPNNLGQPLALAKEQITNAELVELDKEILARGQEMINERNAQAWAQQREQLAYDLIEQPKGEAAIDRIVQQQNQINVLQDTVLNQHLVHTAQIYGRERFETAYNHLLSSLNPNDPRDRAYLQNEILSADSPGEAILERYESGAGRAASGRGSGMPPSLNSQQAAWGRDSSSRDAGRYSEWAVDAESRGRPYSADREADNDVMASVWRD